MRDSKPVITVRGLRNSFGEQIVHENLDLDVRRVVGEAAENPKIQ